MPKRQVGGYDLRSEPALHSDRSMPRDGTVKANDPRSSAYIGPARERI